MKLREFRKLLCMVMIVVLVMTPSMSFAASSSFRSPFLKNTVITEENVNEILTYYGIDPSTGVKNNRPVEKVTVGDLESILAEAKQLPAIIYDYDDNIISGSKDTSGNIMPMAISGYSTTTNYNYSNPITNCTMEYSASAQYYWWANVDYDSYWTVSYGGDVDVYSETFPGGYYDLTQIHSIFTSVINPYTSSSILRLTFDYTITLYIGVVGFSYPTTSNRITGYKNWAPPY